MNDLDWMKEHEFWYTRFRRAAIRFEVAMEKKDFARMAIARKQTALYLRRMQDSVPESIKGKWRQRKNQERVEALNEELDVKLSPDGQRIVDHISLEASLDERDLEEE